MADRDPPQPPADDGGGAPTGPIAPEPSARRRAATLGGRAAAALGDTAVALGDKAAALGGKVVGQVVDQIEHVADAMHLPVPKTRKSRVLFRSVVVGFLVVAGWIGGLLWWQMRGAAKPDLRPVALRILGQLRAGDYHRVYVDASPRLQERTIEEAFAREMANMNATLGGFREITSVSTTEVVRGPSGKSARIGLVLSFDKASGVRGSLSFHWEDNQWRLLGVSVELPPEIARIATSEDQRLARVEGDPARILDALAILLRLQRGDAGKVWDDAAPIFQRAVSRDDFIALEKQRRKELGKFRRIHDVTSNQSEPFDPRKVSNHVDKDHVNAALVLLVEYEGTGDQILSVQFEFRSADGFFWKLASFRPIMPAPRVPS